MIVIIVIPRSPIKDYDDHSLTLKEDQRRWLFPWRPPGSRAEQGNPEMVFVRLLPLPTNNNVHHLFIKPHHSPCCLIQRVREQRTWGSGNKDNNN